MAKRLILGLCLGFFLIFFKCSVGIPSADGGFQQNDGRLSNKRAPWTSSSNAFALGVAVVKGLSQMECPWIGSDLAENELAERVGERETKYNLDRISRWPMLQPRETEVLISFAGDCTLGTDESFSYLNSFPYQFERQGQDYGYFFRNVKHIFEADDLTLVNLETTLTTASEKADKKYRFRGEPEYVNILKAGSIEMVNIANNHIYDYLDQGFNDTLRTLEEADIVFSGEGYISYYPVKGITIASLGYTGWNNKVKKELKGDIKEARKNADIVIVSFHWGQEHINYPMGSQIELAHLSIDQGADVVIGHHPHVLQGIEKYKGKFIVYSLANFSFGGNRNPSDKDTIIFQNTFTVKDKNVIYSEGQIIPCQVSSVPYVNNYQPALVEQAEGERILSRIFLYSSALEYGISEEMMEKEKQ